MDEAGYVVLEGFSLGLVFLRGTLLLGDQGMVDPRLRISG